MAEQRVRIPIAGREEWEHAAKESAAVASSLENDEFAWMSDQLEWRPLHDSRVGDWAGQREGEPAVPRGSIVTAVGYVRWETLVAHAIASATSSGASCSSGSVMSGVCGRPTW